MILIRWKNYENSTFFPIWPLVQPSKISLAFFIFLRSLMPKKSSGMQKNLFLNRISPQKINKPKIPFYFNVVIGNFDLDSDWTRRKQTESVESTKVSTDVNKTGRHFSRWSLLVCSAPAGGGHKQTQAYRLQRLYYPYLAWP